MVSFSLNNALALLTVSQLASASTFSVVDNTLSTWNQAEWSLTANKLVQGQFQSRLSLANGYVGASLAAAGPFFEIDVNQTDPHGEQPINGWPLDNPRISFSTISAFFDLQPKGSRTNYQWLDQYGWESFVSGIPHPTALIFEFGGVYLDASVDNSTISNFTNKINFKTGVADWSYTWKPKTVQTEFKVSFTVIFSRQRPNVIAVKAGIVASNSVCGTITDLLDGRSASRTYLNEKGLKDNSNTIHSSVHPDGLANTTAYIFSTTNITSGFADASSRKQAAGGQGEATIGQTWNISLSPSKPAIFYKYVGVASTDVFPDAASVAEKASQDASCSGFDALVDEHASSWGKLMKRTQIDDFTDPVTDQLPESEEIQILQAASVANAFYLLQNLNPPPDKPDSPVLNDNSLAVGGLTSDSYAGLIFWDADYWMAPGLNIAFPGFAQQIPNFRLKQHPMALENAAFNHYSSNAAIYPWTAGKYGNCTGTGPCIDYEYHVNYDIAFNMLEYRNTTGNQKWWTNGPGGSTNSTPIDAVLSIAAMTGDLLKFNQTLGRWTILNMTDPDEYANFKNNGAFTMASAAEVLRIANDILAEQGQPINTTWADQSTNVEIPRAASGITLEYSTMDNNVLVKQADVVLMTYPLDFSVNYSSSTKLLDLDYYSNKQSQNGPAMTYSIFAVDANTLSPSGCAAYTYTLNGILPYLRAPFYQFSEQAIDDYNINGGTNPAFPFLTGHGGANQIVPYGFLGLRTDKEIMYINPALPPQIPHIRVRNFFYAGAGFSAFMNQTHTTITRFDTSSDGALFDKYKDTSMPFAVGIPGATTTKQTIKINETLTIPNRQYFSNTTMPGNLVQCLPVVAESTYAAGQFPAAAIDGATATRWQPATDARSAFLINTTSLLHTTNGGAKTHVQIGSVYFNWGLRTPRRVGISVGNHTNLDDGTVDPKPGTTAKMTLSKPVKEVHWSVTPNLPYMVNSADSEAVVEVVGNSSLLTVNTTLFLGKWLRVEVEGCWMDDGKGPTVGEVVVYAK